MVGNAQVILIVCGSSASWLIQKIIANKGGLYNRITGQIKLEPFNLLETDAYLKSRKIKLLQRHVLSIYMALGGVPYYLRYLEPGLTAEQNIQRLIFDPEAPLKDEYNRLFDSLFDHAEAYYELIQFISTKKEGMSRTEIAASSTSSTAGGRLTKRLKDLTVTGFIEAYIPWEATKGEYYKLTDEFCLFHLRWVEPHKSKIFIKDYWIKQSKRPSYYAWAGYAFEAVCMKHINQIIEALRIPATTYGTWRYIPAKKSSDDGAQIDLVVDRIDDALNLCEIKYTEQPFVIDKATAMKLNRVVEVFREKTRITKQIFLSIISANGLKENMYTEDLISSVVTLKDLFKSSN